MKNSRNRPRRENGRKVTVIKKSEACVTQLELAQIQQLQSDLSNPGARWPPIETREQLDALQESLRKRWNTLRMQLLRGVEVEPGPIRAFLRKSGNTQKLFVK